MFSFFILSWLASVSLGSGLPPNCTDVQYPWPVDGPNMCCDKCPPGHIMQGSSSRTSCERECVPCQGDRFMESYNMEFNCNVCGNCDRPNMEVKQNCSSTHNTVCTCRAGYRCRDDSCSMCVLIPTTTPTTTPTAKATEAPPTAAPEPGDPTTLPAPRAPLRDTVWFLVITALLCAGIALAVAARIKPFLRWIRSRYGYFLAEKPAAQSSEDEDVSKPVQEVCGKCEQLIDVCVKD
ncbi:CD27 antigen [Stegastes partitus]|uniref:CD27 antigen n=1 Tax=Stegastes partitus TaxID=144197 RepID=A0A9Y4KAR6_9TELE|nr:PREDICTED: CD27 antigen [Stegastes partitus]